MPLGGRQSTKEYDHDLPNRSPFCDSFIREEARNLGRASVPAASAAPVVAVERSPGVRYSARCSACGDFGTVVLYDSKQGATQAVAASPPTTPEAEGTEERKP